MIPYGRYNGKHYIFYSKDRLRIDSSWYIIALDYEPCSYQVEEIAFRLCGNNIRPAKKLAVSNNNSCYVSFGFSDAAVVRNDLMLLQDEHKARFWYDENYIEGCDWDVASLEKISQSNCVLLFASVNRILKEQDVLFRELKYAAENDIRAIIVPIGYNNSAAFINTVRNKLNRMDGIDTIIDYLSSDSVKYALRKRQGFTYMDHFIGDDGLLSKLAEYGVIRNER
jgi:hypothetical protein